MLIPRIAGFIVMIMAAIAACLMLKLIQVDLALEIV
jgi:hypothetical protein